MYHGNAMGNWVRSVRDLLALYVKLREVSETILNLKHFKIKVYLKNNYQTKKKKNLGRIDVLALPKTTPALEILWKETVCPAGSCTHD